jgi:hypothetical protein
VYRQNIKLLSVLADTDFAVYCTVMKNTIVLAPKRTDVVRAQNIFGRKRAKPILQVTVKQLSFIANAKTAFEQWLSLKRVYEPVGSSQLAALLAAFHGYTYRSGLRVDKVASDLTTL